jgi:hypothetical protein
MRWERRGGVLHALSYLLQQSRSYGRATGPSVFFWVVAVSAYISTQRRRFWRDDDEEKNRGK